MSLAASVLPRDLPPPRHLADRIEAFWHHEGDGGELRVLPDGCMDSLHGAEVLIPRRKTFYGATEAWLELAGNVILGLAEHA